MRRAQLEREAMREEVTLTALERLPLVTLYLSERCNSRCVTCDYWRNGTADLTLAGVKRLLPELARLGTELVLLSGGEPLVNSEWAQIATTLRDQGLRLWLLTSGLALAKHAARAARLFETITVSLDGTNRATYAAIRGLDAFDKVCEGIGAVAREGATVSVRVTLQRANFRELKQFVRLAHDCGAHQVSFLAVDVANPHAFGRDNARGADVALTPEELPVFGALLEELEREHAHDFRQGFIAESPAKLRRLHQYFAALHGQSAYPPVHCNAPEFSAVIDARGSVHPCFFIPGAPGARVTEQASLGALLNSAPMKAQRAGIRAGARAECTTCVCPLWRASAAAATRPLERARRLGTGA